MAITYYTATSTATTTTTNTAITVRRFTVKIGFHFFKTHLNKV